MLATEVTVCTVITSLLLALPGPRQCRNYHRAHRPALQTLAQGWHAVVHKAPATQLTACGGCQPLSCLLIPCPGFPAWALHHALCCAQGTGSPWGGHHHRHRPTRTCLGWADEQIPLKQVKPELFLRSPENVWRLIRMIVVNKITSHALF